MRFYKSFWSFSAALLATAALILIEGVAGAVIDADESIDPESPNFDGSEGAVDVSGDEFKTSVSFDCLDSDNDFQFGCESTHNDNVNLSTHQGKLDQKTRNNNAHAWMAVTKMGGKVENTTFDLACEKVLIKGRSNDDTEKIEAKCTLKKCDPPNTDSKAEVRADQIQSAFNCLDGSEEDGSLGKRVQNLRLIDGEISGEFRSKGVWLGGN